MFRPVKLTRVTIQVPQDVISPVMSVLGDLRLLHLIRVEQTHLGRLGYVATLDKKLLEQYAALDARAGRLLKALGPEARVSVPLAEAQPPDKEVFGLEEELGRIEREAIKVLEGLELNRKQRNELDGMAAVLGLLEPADIDFGQLRDLKYIAWRIGLLPSEGMDRFEESLGDIHHALIPIGGTEDGRQVLMVFTLKDDEPVLERALKSAFWEALNLPETLAGRVSDLIRERKAASAELGERLAGLEAERQRLISTHGQKLAEVAARIRYARQLIRAQAQFGKVDSTFLISGWVPLTLFEDLKSRVLEVTSGRAVIEKTDPEDIREVRSGLLRIPILFNNPALIRPFERLTSLYGTPSYDEVEPTAFLAVSFLVFFGMMFGDVGHGVVLTAVGYLVFRRLYRYMDYGIILMESGVASMIFGVFYGSVFGLENLIPAVWMHPLDNIGRFVKVATVVGVVMISLGLVLNLVNILRRKEYCELLSVSGPSGMLLYWLLAGLGIRYLLTGQVQSWELDAVETAAGVLVVVMVLQRPLRAWWVSRHEERPGGRHPSLGMSLAESVIEVFDGVLRGLAGTVSFIRLAAFALTHAALFIAVFAMADMVEGVHGGGLWYWMVLVVGNAVILVLEGLVVSIQTVRLEYYEFFCRFFRGGGESFHSFLKED